MLSEIITHKPQLLTTLQCSWRAWQLCGTLHSTSHVAILLLTRGLWSHVHKALCGSWSGKAAVQLQLRSHSSAGAGILDNETWLTAPIRHFSSPMSHLLALDGIWALGIDMEPAVYAMAIQGIKSGAIMWNSKQTKKWPCNLIALHSTQGNSIYSCGTRKTVFWKKIFLSFKGCSRVKEKVHKLWIWKKLVKGLNR